MRNNSLRRESENFFHSAATAFHYHNLRAATELVPAMAIEFQRIIPILRIFDEAKAKEFYVGFLGFTVDWEHRFEENFPLFMQVSRGNLIFHLSEHHGDASPGSAVTVSMTGIDEYHREVIAKKYTYGRPGVETTPWKSRTMTVHDPFGNRIHFDERFPEDKAQKNLPAVKAKRASGKARRSSRKRSSL